MKELDGLERIRSPGWGSAPPFAGHLATVLGLVGLGVSTRTLTFKQIFVNRINKELLDRAMAMPAASPRKGIKDLFYETRVLMGREYTAQRFAAEVLGGSIHPVALGYIEKGTRLPSEALVRRLAAARKEDPQVLLAVLCRDRMIQAFGKELRRVLHTPRQMAGIEDADLAALMFQAIAALPDDGSWEQPG